MLDRFRFSMPALIALILLVYFGLALFGKSFWPAFIVDTTFGQTLVNLTIAGCAYFLGTTQGSAKAHEVIAAAATAAVPQPPPAAPELASIPAPPPTAPPITPPAAAAPPPFAATQPAVSYPIDLPADAYARLKADGWTDDELAAANMKPPAP